MTVVLLKEDLTKLGLSLVGNKAALVARVTKARDDGIPLQGSEGAESTQSPEIDIVGPYEKRDDMIRGMVIVLLKRGLHLLDLSQMGNRPELVARLIKTRDEGIPYLTPEQAANPGLQVLISHGLPHTAHWELLSRDKETEFVNEIEFSGQRYRVPTAPREEFERTGRGGGGSKKFAFPDKFERPAFKLDAEVPTRDRLGRFVTASIGDFKYSREPLGETPSPIW
eukprot:CAMPEP_0113309902 /NCGR_PEP_ID=MMETSP0010_2-20120614/7756_1 /TAXON_ID=216773 ORGANISM="Corethron hystrix, Strain 308" /NCGR_SAMPLE_ID=MMETSP0010_2 /ASSEMBLY_ACC=CAM_ASM_000155 /LENGTH=224 /DNA_ID=CAMNT_0000165239 /DNA_START=667 /DNA_END=1338 /DNA_ORIENTATION=+ /assembly_acc=CAM_ASM_000155